MEDMVQDQASTQATRESRLRLLSMSIALILGVAQSAMTFLITGTWRLPFFWAAFGIQALVALVGAGILDPELIYERLHPPKGEDKDVLGPLILGVLYPIHLILASLDVGYWHLSDNVPFALRLLALPMLTIGWTGFLWTMRINRFFSSAVRVQRDRAQTVVTNGPYRYVRHPGYAFAIVALLSQSLALGSWLCCGPVLLIIWQLLYRISVEEKLLLSQLDGYRDYAANVRFRLVPYVW